MNDDARLDAVLLRSFLAVAETLHFTAAARRRGLGQSTVSQHVSRLEQAVGRPLLVRNTKSVELTADGAAMVEMARDILAAQDRALAWFDRSELRGRLRFGVGEDLVLSRLPDVLRAFRRSHPKVELDLTVGLSSELHDALDKGALDLMFAKRPAGEMRGTLVARAPLLWFGGAECRVEPDAPVPLVLFPGSSITRRAAIDALNRADRGWHVAFSSQSLAAMTAAVRAGYGITAQCGLLAGPGLVPLPTGHGALPSLPEVEFIVLARHDRPTVPAQALMDAIRDESDLLASPAAAVQASGGVAASRPDSSSSAGQAPASRSRRR
jgi:DNA-binding transcriptional LysR family regulator